jgi:multimeric flavodoxin WrbA
MNIAVVTGTEVKGCTYRIKEIFLEGLRAGNQIAEFTLPKDMPHFCCGCKVCFFKDEKLCPHADRVLPIWNAMREADLIVFASPVYVLRAPGQVKALLDHFGCRWMVHRPDPVMFSKRAAILTNSIGAPNGKAQKDIMTGLHWLGVSRVRRLGFGLMEGVIWDELSAKRRAKIERKTQKFARAYRKFKPARKSLKVRFLFGLSRFMHKVILKKETVPSADSQYWIEHGWIKGKGDSGRR